MKLSISLNEMLELAKDFDALCDDIGINPYCMAEGLATGYEIQEIDIDVAKRHGLLD